MRNYEEQWGLRAGAGVRAVTAVVLCALAVSAQVACATSTGRGPQLEEVRDAGAADGAVMAALPEGRDALLEIADQDAAPGPKGPQLKRSLAAAQKLLEGDPQDAAAAWRAARALYLMALNTEGEAASALAEQCQGHAQTAAAATEPGAEAPYYSALCEAVWIQANESEALARIPKIVERAELALERDPKLVHAGPHRMLGAIYLRAPAWPTSVGDLDAALEHLEKAAALAPRWPQNHLLLAEALLEDQRPDAARKAARRAKKLMKQRAVAGWRALWKPDLRKLEQRLRASGGTYN